MRPELGERVDGFVQRAHDGERRLWQAMIRQAVRRMAALSVMRRATSDTDAR